MPDRSRPLLIALLLLGGLAGCGGDGEGAPAAAARFRDAVAALREADREVAGGRSPAPALARAAAGIAAARAAGGAALAGPCDFLEGNAAWIACDAAEAAAFRRGADPAALDGALALADAARDGWVRAASSRPDWPEALRNVERALLRRRRIEKDRAAADREKGGTPPAPAPAPGAAPPEGETAPGEAPAVPAPAAAAGDLLERLAAMEREKREARRAARDAAGAGVERDW